ncbi:hypothetical protein SFRURICE_001250 [Spodoptera frugiperda]|uniref:SFRICE_030662 n=1 Tax=Spodoptera frugiperda TaxID=7108 RepID=A0A2H1WZ83_SPOFR|nr:hypothetical protein SFRURICE_001250 [Spodoptera frugiperda]
MAAEKYGRRQTGGGPPPPKPSETTEWLNSIMGESISGLPAMYDSDALINDAANMEIETIDLGTTANINLDLSQKEIVEDYVTTKNFLDVERVLPEPEQPMKENIPNNLELSSSNQFDTSTPKAMLRQPVSKELSFNQKKRKSVFTPLETRKKIVMHAEKKIDLLNKKQGREIKRSHT